MTFSQSFRWHENQRGQELQCALGVLSVECTNTQRHTQHLVFNINSAGKSKHVFHDENVTTKPILLTCDFGTQLFDYISLGWRQRERSWEFGTTRWVFYDWTYLLLKYRLAHMVSVDNSRCSDFYQSFANRENPAKLAASHFTPPCESGCS